MTNLIDAAMVRLAAPGELCKDGSYGDVHGDGPVCIRGSLIAVGASLVFSPEAVAITDTLRSKTGDGAITRFNDADETTLEAALAVMERASALYDEQNAGATP